VPASPQIPAPPLTRACARFGLDAREARVLHVRANAVYHLPRPRHDVVLRLRYAPDNPAALNRLNASINITRWLAEKDFPTIIPLPVDQPAVIDGWIATLWVYVTEPPCQTAEAEDLARILQDLHALPKPPVPVPALEPLGTLQADLEAIDGVVTEQQLSWLLEQCRQVEHDRRHTNNPLGHGLLHGDAHTGNLLRDRNRWLLGDWDSVAYGPLLQDLIPMMLGHRRFGQPRTDWINFCEIYGIDPDLEFTPAAEALIAARELRSLAAYIRAADRRAVRRELERRLASLMTDDPLLWRPV
jgi:aminoglycoside phosphotransferase (APT) family kinase protein